MVKVKICGITRASDAVAACELGADLIGLNFYSASPRFVTLQRAAAIREAIGPPALVVGVFVKPSREFVDRALRDLGLDMLQIHGDESGEILSGWPVPAIRPVSLRPGQTPLPIAAHTDDYVLIDSYDPRLYGGTGHAIAIDDLRKLDLRRCFVAGGLTPESVKAVAALGPYGVDVASGVESAPGIKDHQKLRSFIRNAKSSG